MIGVGESFICHLEELRSNDDESSQPRKKRKKVNIVAGKSVSAKDVQQQLEQDIPRQKRKRPSNKSMAARARGRPRKK